MTTHPLTDSFEYVSKDGRHFSIRGIATRGDKYKMNTAMAEGTVSANGKEITTSPGKLYPWLIEHFVVSCKEISGYGKDILDHLMEEPSDPEEDLIMVLGAHILTHVKGLITLKEDGSKKKD